MIKYRKDVKKEIIYDGKRTLLYLLEKRYKSRRF